MLRLITWGVMLKLTLLVMTEVATREEEGLFQSKGLVPGLFPAVPAPPKRPALPFTKKICQRLANSCDSFPSSPASYAGPVRLNRLCRNPELNPALFFLLQHKI